MRVCNYKISHLKNKESVVKLNECTFRGCYRYLLPLLQITDTIFFNSMISNSHINIKNRQSQ